MTSDKQILLYTIVRVGLLLIAGAMGYSASKSPGTVEALSDALTAFILACIAFSASLANQRKLRDESPPKDDDIPPAPPAATA